MGTIKNTLKAWGRQAWEFFKGSFPAALMYFCAGSVLMMLTMKEDEIFWDSGKLTWTLVCGLAAAAYNALLCYGQGGNAYEMLVSGNIKRTAIDSYGSGYKMSSHKYAKEYRAWKGFAMGAFTGIYVVIFGIVLGCNQASINSQSGSMGLAVLLIIGFLLAGWSILPFYYLNASGVYVSYFVSCAFVLVPIIVSGVFYILGAYGRRNKAIREQMLADKAAAAEAVREKKINYGGLPGTKPRKRK
ncbi:MAG: hypothetical protein J6B56_01965 [Clostridia bacterium]|nr:hypothetical protein [Clostridia bacterium]